MHCSEIKPQQHLAGSTGDEQIPKAVKEWFNTCLQSHDGCPGKALSPSIYPPKLIDLEFRTRTQDPSWRLIDAGTTSISGQYMTLSLRW